MTVLEQGRAIDVGGNIMVRSMKILLIAQIAFFCLCILAQDNTTGIYSQYESIQLRELVSKAVKDIASQDRKAAEDAVRLFFDLRRTDLLVLGLKTRNYDLSSYTVRYIERLSHQDQMEIALLSLADDAIFVPEMKIGELIAAQSTFMDNYSTLIRTICEREKVKLREDWDVMRKEDRKFIIGELEDLRRRKLEEDLPPEASKESDSMEQK